MGFAARIAALGGLAAGLALAPSIGAPSGRWALIASALVAAALLGTAAPRGGGGRGRSIAWPTASIWLALLAALAGTAGIAAGSLRVEAIDAGAFAGAPGRELDVDGFVDAVPRRAAGRVSIVVDTPEGRLLVEVPEPVGDLDVGAAVSASGVVRAPSEFERGYLERLGIRRVLASRRVTVGPARRDGLVGLLDAVRVRAQHALSAGTPSPSAALLRGFVLGQDDRIAAGTVEEFKRSGLAHLLAVSGQNVVLLTVLVAFGLGLLGLGLRARLAWVIALIAVYVLVTGAGPSIQRAGVMGVAGAVAVLAGRPSSRWYALLLAAASTLALDPRSAGDVGWQLSFAAVAGILLVAAPLARLFAGDRAGAGRRALAEAGALTIAATAATAPLMAFHFGTLSIVSLPANLVALPAEAPVMWLGMLAAAAGQLEWIPVEPITWLAGLLAAYIAQVAAWFAAPGWAQLELGLGGVAALAAAYLSLAAALWVGLRATARRRALLRGAPNLRRGRALAVACAVGLSSVVALAAAGAPSGSDGDPETGLRVRVLDVGQGDSILLEPPDGPPVLVDAGPPGGAAADRLNRLGIESLAGLVVTHPDLDHAGGAAEVLASVRVERLIVARADRAVLGAALTAGAQVVRVGAGAVLRAGGLRLEVLWPGRADRRALGAEEPNASSLVLLARWRHFRLLLAGDAEAEVAPVEPGDLDALKVAHHGSQDAGLAALLERTDPELALISVGAGNPYGHPAPATLSDLAAAGVAVRRTDADGELVLDADRRGWSVANRD